MLSCCAFFSLCCCLKPRSDICGSTVVIRVRGRMMKLLHEFHMQERSWRESIVRGWVTFGEIALDLTCNISSDSTWQRLQSHANMVSKQSGDQKTDATRWRLRDVDGQQTWHYLSEEQAKEWPQTTADKYFLGLPTVCASPSPVIIK
jgi:hypothetical protein